MISKFQTTVVKILTNNKVKNYCIQNKVSIGTTMKKALEDVYDMNPCIVFKRKIKLNTSISVRLNYTQYAKYTELKGFLSGYGLGLMLYDYIINHESYLLANQKTLDLNNNFVDKMSELDKQIMQDITLTEIERNFLIELDLQSKEALYIDRDLLKTVILDSE